MSLSDGRKMLMVRLDTTGLTQPDSGPVGASVGHNHAGQGMQPTMVKAPGGLHDREYRAKQVSTSSRTVPGYCLSRQSFVSAVCQAGKTRRILQPCRVARGNGKSHGSAGKLVARSITPDDQLFVEGAENILGRKLKDRKRRSSWNFRGTRLGSRDAYRWRQDGVDPSRTPGRGSGCISS